MAAVAVADTVRDGSPTLSSDGASKTWGRGGARTTALVTPAPGAPAGGSTGPSAAASFFIRYVPPGVLGHTQQVGTWAAGPRGLRAFPGRAVADLPW